MDILVTGQLATVSSSFCDKLSKHYRVVASSEDININYIGNIFKKFNYAVNSESYSKLFNVYSFETVVFFANRPELGGNVMDELNELDRVLSLCCENNVPKVIFVSSTYIYDGIPSANENTAVSPSDSDALLLWSCEKLCEFYQRNKGLSVVTLHAPCLFGHYENQSLIGRLIQQAVSRNYLRIEGNKNQLVDFLSLEDLSKIILRIMTQWPEEATVINLSGVRCMTLSQLADCFGANVYQTRVSFTGQSMAVCAPVSYDIARHEYDWVPIIDISKEIPTLVEHIHRNDENKLTLTQKIKNIISSKSMIVKTTELVLGFLMMEYLNNITATAVQFRYVDFRLLFVMLLAIVHGSKLGVAASLLASFSCVAAYISGGMDWRILIYNIDNWLPFACYIIAGTVIGYTRDKKDKELNFITDEKDSLDKRYAFLNELYQNALQSKNQYKKQIMSYRNSFGRLFEVTKRLNTLTPDIVYMEALHVLEDILDNQSVAIYNTTKNTGFARLMVCSKKYIDISPKSLLLTEYDEFISSMSKGDVWANTECDHRYPDYAFPVFRDDRLISIIMINKASHEQMAMYYENLIKILCNMIEDSLVRAQEFTEELKNDLYIQDSDVLKKKAFKNILNIREQMAKDATSEYSMFCVDADSDSIVEVAELIHSYFRETDVFGQGDDNKLYIILTQADKDVAPRIMERLKSKGVI